MMKKLFVLLTVAIAMLALPLAAHADKTKWANPNYDFSQLRNIDLVSISIVEPYEDAFSVDDMASEKIIGDLQKALAKRDFTFKSSVESNLTITREAAAQLAKDALSSSYSTETVKIAPEATADLKIIAHKFGYRTRIIPAHQEPRTRTFKEKSKDNNGNWVERDVQRTVYEYVPETTAYDAQIDVSFQVFDPATGKIIFNLRDVRERSQDSDTTDMWKRMVNYFAQELQKAVKNAKK